MVRRPQGFTTADGAARAPHRRRERKWLSVLFLVLVAAFAGAISGGLVARFSEADVQTTSSVPVPPPEGGPGPRLNIADVIANIRPSVLAINVTSRVTVGTRTIMQEGTGTGFVLTSDGMIATNAHVVSGAQQITVTLADESIAPASLVGINVDKDLAVIRADKTGLVPAPLGQSTGLRVGDMVIAVGNALALEGGPSASLGIVSALERTITTSGGKPLTHLIQTDAAINAGDSGGPLIDAQGRVVGINTAGTTEAENIGFAIPIDEAAPILEVLRASKQ